MVNNDSANLVIALVAILVGVLNCFFGYRILKVVLGVTGFCAGASAGWAASAALAQGNAWIALVCALLGGVIGALLCIWLYFLGIFLLGAGFGAVLASAFLTGSGVHAQIVIILIAALICGAIALALQKFMIIISTAFGGAYLLVGGILHFMVGGQNPVPVLFDRAPLGSWGTWGYAPLVAWLVLGLVGVALQYRGTRETVEVVREQRMEA